MMNDRQSITVRFDQVHDLSHRVTLVERLQKIHGVVSAAFTSHDDKNLIVKFRQNSFSEVTLLDYLKLHRMTATVIGND